MKLSLSVCHSVLMAVLACLPAWVMAEELDITISVINEGETPAEFVNRIQLPPLTTLNVHEDMSAVEPSGNAAEAPTSEVQVMADDISQELKSVVTDTQKTQIGLGELQSLPEDIVEKIPPKIVEEVINNLPVKVNEVTPVVPEDVIDALESDFVTTPAVDVEGPDIQGIVDELKNNATSNQEAIEEAAKSATEMNKGISNEVNNSIEALQQQQEVDSVTDGLVPDL